MGRSTRSIPVIAKMKIPERLFDNWGDGGELEILKKWGAVGWAYDIANGHSTIYATAVTKHPELNDDFEPTREYTPEEVIFLVDEDPYWTGGRSASQCVAFVVDDLERLRQFAKDLGLDSTIEENVTVQQTL